ncbi:MAG: hypothetical protein P1V97_24595, partial [Planctomycetota bacterium]|nr:hypothetical protein [Planctomycetota bacterium]
FPGVNSSHFFHSSTNELGTFSLAVPDGQGWLLVMAPGYASRIQELRGRGPKQLILNVEERLTGTARNEEGIGVAKVLVNAYAKGTINRFQSGRQVLRGREGLKYGMKTPTMIVSGNKLAPMPLASTITDRFGRYSLAGLDSGEYDVVVNPLWSYLDKKSEWSLLHYKAVPTGSELDFELKSIALATARLKAIDAQTREVMIGCKIRLFNEAGPMNHFSDPWKDFDPAILQFSPTDKLTFQLSKPGYARTQLSFSALPNSSLNLGAVYLNPVVGALNLEVKTQLDAWEKIEFFIHEKESDLWSWQENKLTQEIERIEFPDLTPGAIEIKPFLRGGEWPNESFMKLETIESEIGRDMLTIEKLDLRGSQFKFRKQP